MSKKPLTEEQLKDASRLRAIYAKKAKALGITQEKIGAELGGKGQSAIGNYLKGLNALNVKSAIIFSRMLEVPVKDFSPSLAEEIESARLTKSDLLDSVLKRLQTMKEQDIQATSEFLDILERSKR